MTAVTRVALHDLRHGGRFWLGAAFVCAVVAWFVVTCLQFVAAIAGASGSLFTTPGIQGTRDEYLTVGVNLLVFSGLPALVVLTIVLGTVATQTAESHALWRLGGASPGQVRAIIVLQATVVAVISLVVGALLTLPSQAAVNTLLLRNGRSSGPTLEAATSWPAMLGAVAVLVLLVIAAAVLPSRRASRLSPLVVRSAAHRSGGPGRTQFLIALGFLIVVVLPLGSTLAALRFVDGPVFASITTLPLGQALVVATALFSPWIMPRVVRAWTKPFHRSTTFGIARHLAATKVASSSAIAAPLVVGIGLFVSFTMVSSTAAAVVPPGGGQVNAFEGAMTIVPVGVIAIAGSIAVVFMAARERAVELTTLRSAWANERDLRAIVVKEAVIVTVSALLVVLVPALMQAALLGIALQAKGVSFTRVRVDLVPAALIAVIGFLGIVTVLLWSGRRAWRQPLAALMADR